MAVVRFALVSKAVQRLQGRRLTGHSVPQRHVEYAAASKGGGSRPGEAQGHLSAERNGYDPDQKEDTVRIEAPLAIDRTTAERIPPVAHVSGEKSC